MLLSLHRRYPKDVTTILIFILAVNKSYLLSTNDLLMVAIRELSCLKTGGRFVLSVPSSFHDRIAAIRPFHLEGLKVEDGCMTKRAFECRSVLTKQRRRVGLLRRGRPIYPL